MHSKIAMGRRVFCRRVSRRLGYSILFAGLVLGLSAWLWQLRANTHAEARRLVQPEPGGTLLICGGGKLPVELRRRFYDRAGGGQARIVVIPGLYVGDDQELSQAFLEPWERLGAQSVKIVSASSPQSADTAAFVRAVADATGVWLGGGDQEWLSATYSGTQIEQEIKHVLERGGVVGGSSAGAAVMSPLMIAGGRGNAVEASGLGLLPDTVIDQHLLKRNRLNRLLGVVSTHPELIGFGVDERTALEVRLRNNRLSVIGESYVVACVPGARDHRARVEILKRGDETSLLALRESNWIVPREDFDDRVSSAGE